MDPEIHSAEREAAANPSAKVETDLAAPNLEQEHEELREEDGRTYVVTAEDHKAADWYGDLQKVGMARMLKSAENGPAAEDDQDYGLEQVRSNQDAIQQQFADRFRAKADKEMSDFVEDISYQEPSQVEAEVAAQREQLTSKIDSLDEKIDRINFRLEDPGTRFNLEKIDGRQELKEQFRIFEQLMREKAMAEERLSALDKHHEQYKSRQIVQQKDAEQNARLSEAAQKAGVEVPADLDKNRQKTENLATDEKKLPNEDSYVLNEKDLHNLDRYYTERFRKHIDDSPSQLKYHLDAQLSILNRELSDTRTSAESYQRSVDIHTRAIESGDSHAKAYSREAIEDAKEHLAELTLQARYLEAAIPWLQNKINETKQKNAEYWRQQSDELRQTPGSQAKAEQAEANAHFWESAGAGA